MASNRHLGRIVALQTLYEYEFRLSCNDTNLNVDEILKRNIHRDHDNIDDQDFITKLVKDVIHFCFVVFTHDVERKIAHTH
jgi:N utilization substance protein B